MRTRVFVTSLLMLALLLPVYAVIGKTPQAFTESGYAKALNVKPTLSKPDLTAYLGSGKELIILKTKREMVYFERLSWMSTAMPKEEAVRHEAYIKFLTQAAELAEGSAEYEQMVQSIRSNAAEFRIKSLVVRQKVEKTERGDQYFVEIFSR